MANYVTVSANAPTCIGLAGPSKLLGTESLFGLVDGAAAESRSIVTVRLLQIEAECLRDALSRSSRLCNPCLQQQQMQLISTQRIAACNARHLLPARCAHWLAQLQVRLGDVLPVTHRVSRKRTWGTTHRHNRRATKIAGRRHNPAAA